MKYGIGEKGMSGQTRRINISNQKKRRILCIANEYDYLGDGAIIYEEKLQVGKQYTFVKGEVQSCGVMVRLKELPRKYGYPSYLFEELPLHDEKILEKEYTMVESDCREGVRAKLERMKELCKERNNLYEKQNDLKGQKQKTEKSLER